jgi:hypothetical protein
MSKAQEKALKLASSIAVPIIAVLIALGTYKQQMTDGFAQIKKCVTQAEANKGDIRELKTDIKWLIESGKRIEGKLEKK